MELHNDVCQKSIFSGIYDRHAKDLSKYLYYKYGDRLNPDDKMQEAFIKLWENCKNVTPATAKAFLYKVANNLMLNEVKHQKVVLNYQKASPKNYTNESPEFLLEEKQ